MLGKHSLLFFAVLAIGIFVLPNTISLFAGQHVWYDLTPDGNNVPCEKCHADIMDELISSGVHENLSCGGCHRTDTGVDGYADGSGTGAEPGKGAHAASTEECMLCHDGRKLPNTNFTHYYLDPSTCSQCHIGPIILAAAAGGFNITNDPDDTGSHAAHLKFVEDAINETTLVGSNEACVACHTHTAVKLNWTHRTSIEVNTTVDYDLYPPTHFNVSDFTASGTANVTVYGNGSGSGSTSGW